MYFDHRRRLVLAFAGISVALIAITVIGVLGLLRGPSTARELDAPANEASVSRALPPAAKPRPVLVTGSPEQFARSVARALFNWDTRYQGGPSPWAQMVVNVADPDEGTAVASDIRGFLPEAEMWEQLTDYGTRQWLEVKSIVVPKAWSTALRQATPGQIPRGAAALTIVASAHRQGVWNSDAIRTNRNVTFTIFVRCPGDEPCTLLRFSQLDKPLM